LAGSRRGGRSPPPGDQPNVRNTNRSCGPPAARP
jgi:hypothetical protein